jgi:uncharacterized protein
VRSAKEEAQVKTYIDLPHEGLHFMQAVVGSTAYGLAHEGSDVDRLGVYVAANEYVLGLDGPSAVAHTHVEHDPDATIHEVGKFISLALKCNPTILELLFATQEIPSTAANLLVNNRRIFLSTKRVVDAYGGYATQQAKRLMDRHAAGKEGFNADLKKRTAKHGRHCYRLLIMGQHLLRSGQLKLDVSSQRDRIFKVGELAVSDPNAFYELFETERARLDSISSALPDENDRERANDMLLEIRRTLG